MEATQHAPVLVEETMQILDVRPGGHYLDGTLGGGGHTEELLMRSAPSGKVLSLDVDPQALQRSHQRLARYGQRWQGMEGNFRDLVQLGQRSDWAPFDGILLDLGFSSDQLQDADNGLSFQHDGPLDMRLGRQANEDGLTAAEIVNRWSQTDIERLLRDDGEERYAKRIAAAIVTARRRQAITRTQPLIEIIQAAVPRGYEHGRLQPATRTFQALRLAVNHELDNLQQAINAAPQILRPTGRLAIISFHSLEDRIVKQAFRSLPGFQRLNKKPIIAQRAEQEINPRSRSAKLRAALVNAT